MRTGQFSALEMMSPSRYLLDQRMAKVLVHAPAMEFQSLNLQVSASVSQAKQAFQARIRSMMFVWFRRECFSGTIPLPSTLSWG